jgi:hypothetical protein
MFQTTPLTGESDDVREATEWKLSKYAGYVKQVNEERFLGHQAFKGEHGCDSVQTLTKNITEMVLWEKHYLELKLVEESHAIGYFRKQSDEVSLKSGIAK